MSLFDDLLKKPTDAQSTSSGGSAPMGGAGSTGATGQSSGGTQDPLAGQAVATPIVIQTQNDGLIITESPAMTQSAAPSPAPVTTTSDEDASMILIQSVEDHQVAPVLTETPVVQNTVIAPATPIIVSDVAPVTVPASPLIDIVETPVPQDAEVSSIFFDSKPEEVTAFAEEVTQIPVESPTVIAPVLVQATVAPIMTTPTGEVHEHPEDFINASLDRINTILASIDARHDAKVAEADGYKTEKEKFTQLEETAHIDAKKILKEKAHIERMREYLQLELDNVKNGTTSPAIEQIEAIASDEGAVAHARVHKTVHVKKSTTAA